MKYFYIFFYLVIILCLTPSSENKKNVFIYNSFNECAGTLPMCRSNEALVYSNVFICSLFTIDIEGVNLDDNLMEFGVTNKTRLRDTIDVSRHIKKELLVALNARKIIQVKAGLNDLFGATLVSSQSAITNIIFSNSRQLGCV